MEQGLYEQIINKLIASKIEILGREKFHISTTVIDKNEAPIILSKYLSTTINSAFSQIKGEQSLEQQISISNRIIELLSSELKSDLFEEDLIETEANILNAIYAKTNADFSDFSSYLKEITPYTRLSQSELFTGNNAGVSIESELKKEILSSNKICFLVSFIKWSGIRIFKEELRHFTESGGQLQIITTSYMGATDLKAVQFLSELPNTEIKVSYNNSNERLHAKAYLFLRNTGFHTGYIGSSNLSHAAMTSGLEWNVKLTTFEVSQLLSKFHKTFDTYWQDSEFELFDKVKDSEKLNSALKSAVTSTNQFSTFFDLKPYNFQEEILESLEVERTVHERNKNLVVAATGTGKTMISAFDFKRYLKSNPDARLLFIAHRIEILEQALDTFKAVLKDNNFGEVWGDGRAPSNFKNIFASVNTLRNRVESHDLSSDYYDFIIIDEVHHIVASSYRPILKKFSPKVLLGLTATPERMDNEDILSDFDNTVAAEIRLPEALNRKLLVPFQYFGITDSVNLKDVAWQNGKYLAAELTAKYTKGERRVNEIINNVEKYLTDSSKVRALGFCVTQEHAAYMSRKFCEAGYNADYLTSKTGNRREELRLKFQKGEVNFLFVVDIFNEGVDIPEIDTVLFLRPTESLTVFLQQLGRGLRLTEGKDLLTVLDFVANSRPEYDFEGKFRALVGKTNTSIQKELERDFPHLPLGCSIVLERQAKEFILNNIKAATSYNRRIIERKIRSFGNDTNLELTLQNFSKFYNIPIQYIYKYDTWSRLKQKAGVIEDFNFQFEKNVLSALNNKWLSTNSYSYFSFILKLAKNRFSFDLSRFNQEERQMALMLYYDVWQKANQHQSLDVAIRKIGESEVICNEIIEFLSLQIDKIKFLETEISLPYSQPLKLHSRYTRDQILAAFKFSSFEKQSSNREGVAENKDLNTELLFIDLVKSDQDFSPTTLYNDYAISESLFHWQSQNATIPERGKGLSYINQEENNKRILLFIREQKKDTYGRTMGYVFVGNAKYFESEGRKPMNIKWQLSEPLPHYLWKDSAKMFVG